MIWDFNAKKMMMMMYMCGCVPGEVLRLCSAANPADVCVLSIRSLRRSFIYT